MSTTASSLVTATLTVPSSEPSRSSVNYHPSIWGDRFLQYASETMEVDDKTTQQIEKLKEDIRKLLVPSIDEPLSKLNLIDSIQRLGVDYHFEHEIDQVLRHIYQNYVQNGIIKAGNESLATIALLFRLLRQQGYRISPDVFSKFKDKEGNFDERITKDVEGMLNLYEAAHLGIHGEKILDEAIAFTYTQLEFMVPHLKPPLVEQVRHSLRQPLRKGLPRLEACQYIPIYQQHPFHSDTLLTLAKLDFNMLQKLHQKEIANISKWWKDLDFATKLPFARNRIVECYFWILGAYFEPQYSLARIITTKVICMASVIDDIYDVYGTLEELQLFTTAIERWDISCMNFLPEYMGYCYQALLDVYKEIEQDVSKEGRAFCVNYAKTEMKRLTQAYFEEAKWLNRNYRPSMEEYMGIAEISSGYKMVEATSFIGMGSIGTEEAFQWLANYPKIVRASTIIARLMDDIVSNELEQKRMHVDSAVECYMRQHGVTKQEAIEELKRQVINAWKDINEECLEPLEVAKPLLIRILNFSRVMDVLYKESDGYTHSTGETKDNINSLLLNPLPL